MLMADAEETSITFQLNDAQKNISLFKYKYLKGKWESFSCYVIDQNAIVPLMRWKGIVIKIHPKVNDINEQCLLKDMNCFATSISLAFSNTVLM